MKSSARSLFQIDVPKVRTTLVERRAERPAAKHLLTRDLKLAVENYSCKCGGIDLIMKEGSSQLIQLRSKVGARTFTVRLLRPSPITSRQGYAVQLRIFCVLTESIRLLPAVLRPSG